MQVLGWITCGITVLVAIFQIPLMKDNGKGVMIIALRFFVLLLIGIVVTILTPISKLNMLWWIPATYLINVYSFRYFNSNSPKKKTQPEFGNQISWSEAYKQVMKVVDLKKGIQRIDRFGNDLPKYSFEPYGYLIVQSPLFKDSIRLPIIHKDDFLIIESARKETIWKKFLQEHELLVTYCPKDITANGLSTSSYHVLHFAVVPNGILANLYANNRKRVTDEELLHLFKAFSWELALDTE